MKIIADNTVPFLKGIAEPFAQVLYYDANEFMPETVKDADVLIVRSINKCTRELLEGSRVRLITTATIGFDHIDTLYCEEAGITWRNAPGCNAVSVAQYILASLVTMSLRRNESLKGRTIGIVGVGHVGTEVERVCKTYGMNILLNDPPRETAEGKGNFVSLDMIAQEADIITLHVPYTKEGAYATHHLVDTDFFCKLKKKPWLINSCRGAVLDTEALLAAKRDNKVGELIIDCWENEPHISRSLLKEAAIATPHIAGFSADGKANGTKACLQNIGNFFGLTVEKIGEVIPPAPKNPYIDLNMFTRHRTEQAILSSFNPLHIDSTLRKTAEKFEWLRANYNHPHEFNAYTIRNATPEEAVLLSHLGFTV